MYNVNTTMIRPLGTSIMATNAIHKNNNNNRSNNRKREGNAKYMFMRILYREAPCLS